MKKFRRTLCMLLSVLMITAIFTALPFTVNAEGEHTHNDITFAPWNSATSLPTSGNYYLTTDVNVTSTTRVLSGTLNLCLNGHGITSNGPRVFLVENSGTTMNLFDCDTTTTHYYYIDNDYLGHVVSQDDSNYVNAAADKKGSFTGGYITGGTYSVEHGEGGRGTTGHGNAIDVRISAKLNVDGCTFIGNKSLTGGAVRYLGLFGAVSGTLKNAAFIGNHSPYSGGGLYSESNTGTVTLTNCTFTKNYSRYAGGGLASYGNPTATLVINDCSITDNYVSAEGEGGGACAANKSTFKISGNTVISGNTKNGVANNLYITSNSIVKVTDTLTNTTPIGVKLENGTGVFTSSADTDYNVIEKFSSDNPLYAVKKNTSGQLYLVPPNTVTFKNWNGDILQTLTVANGTVPVYTGPLPTKAGVNITYTFSGWSDTTNTYAPNELPEVTEDVTYTAQFTETKKYFVAENLSLDGDIGVNFLIDMHDAVPKNSTVTLHWYKYTEPHTVSNLKTITCNGKTYYIATARVAAKEMADTITATLTENGTVLEEITYSVKTYADKIIKTENLNDLGSQFASMSAEKKAQLKDLCKAMLRYGTASEKQFDDEWQHGGYHTESAIDGIDYDGYVAAAVPASYSMPDYSAFGLEYFASTIGTKTTTNYRVAFKAPAGSNPPTVYYNGEAIAPDTTSGTNVAIYNFNGIHAKNISDDIIVTVNGVEVRFNMLAYITKAAVSGDEKLENSVKALYDYGAKAKIYFG